MYGFIQYTPLLPSQMRLKFHAEIHKFGCIISLKILRRRSHVHYDYTSANR